MRLLEREIFHHDDVRDADDVYDLCVHTFDVIDEWYGLVEFENSGVGSASARTPLFILLCDFILYVWTK